MFTQKNKIFFPSLIIATFFLSFFPNPTAIFAQTDSSSEQLQLQQQLQAIEQQIVQYQQQLAQTQTQKNTLANKIKALKKQQALLSLQIKATNLQINDLGGQITITQGAISQNNANAEVVKGQIAAVMRAIDQSDNFGFLYTAVSQQKLSDVFGIYEDYAQVSKGLSSLVNQLKALNDRLAQQKRQLQDQQEAAQNLLSIKVLQQGQLTDSVSQQNTLLEQTKGQEAAYQAQISDNKTRAEAIRNRIYQLLGVSTQITFGEAVKLAQWAKSLTNIEPAFLLAVLHQESNLGQNVGTCNRPGDPPEKSWRVIMNPTRDQPPFLQITQSLGMNPDLTPVSCPMRDKYGNQIGWGGAMGPAQFIPSTWMGYIDKISQLTGSNPPNPWDVRDAFIAAAIKLTGNGADGTPQGDWNAAMRYFSGSTNAKYRFYGDSVMATMAQYQTDIQNLGQ